MSRRLLAATVAVVALGGGCGGVAPKAPGPQPGDVSVSLVATRFEPNNVVVPVGRRVVWQWTDKVGHNVIADGAAFAPSSVQYGGSYSILFDKAGTYGYQCTLHDGMRGTVVAQ